MDSIDITDSAFSLEVPKTLKLPDEFSSGYTNFIYIGIGILLLAGLFYYKYNKSSRENRKEDVNNLDCPGGFCSMEKCPIEQEN